MKKGLSLKSKTDLHHKEGLINATHSHKMFQFNLEVFITQLGFMYFR